MTTRAEIEAMTKPQMIAFAKERFGKAFSRRNNRPTLINSILHLAGVETNADDGEAAAQQQPGATPVQKGHVTVTVTRCPDSTGVHLNVNGRRFDLPPDKPVPVPAWIIPSLRAVREVDFTVE